MSYRDLLKVFWESHDPTQGMRQGNDRGTQYRSAIFYHSPEQKADAEDTATAYQEQLTRAGYGRSRPRSPRRRSSTSPSRYHQQYLSDNKNPYGYCGLAAPGCPARSAWSRRAAQWTR